MINLPAARGSADCKRLLSCRVAKSFYVSKEEEKMMRGTILQRITLSIFFWSDESCISTLDMDNGWIITHIIDCLDKTAAAAAFLF